MTNAFKDFNEMKNEAERWLEEHKSKYKITACDSTENRIIFSNSDSISFNIICPNKEESWVSSMNSITAKIRSS